MHLSAANLRRHALLLFALLLLAGGGYLLIFRGTDQSSSSFTASILLRAGLVLAALWLSFPQVAKIASRCPPWLVGGVAVCLAILVAFPKRILLIGPILLAMLVLHGIGWLFKPPPPRKRKRHPSSTSERK